MGYFPFYIDIENKNCLIVGGGTVALRKIEKLVPFKPSITVVAPKICNDIYKIEGIKIVNRKFETSDINDVFFVISATDDRILNEHIFKLCSERNILVNTVDDKEYCGFIFPALAVSDNITVGISTSGKSPVFARYLREKTENLIGEDCDKIVGLLGKYRFLVKEEISDEKNRKEAFERILALCINNGSPTDESSILNIIKDLK